jgi:hypothetical protein
LGTYEDTFNRYAQDLQQLRDDPDSYSEGFDVPAPTSVANSASVRDPYNWTPHELNVTREFANTVPSAEAIFNSASSAGLNPQQLASIWSQVDNGNYNHYLDTVQNWLQENNKFLPGTYTSTAPQR